MANGFSLPDIADAIETALRAAAQQADLEQSVLGPDALDELSLHPVLASGLRRAGYGVFGERHYPAGRLRRRDSEGERCDLVLTPAGEDLGDPDREATLFDSPDAVPPGDAFWLEVKVICQFTTEGPNPRYASQLLSTVRQDVAKLSRNPGIRRAAVLLVLFAADERTADHDLAEWLGHCERQGLPVGIPSVRTFGIADRIGNGVCAVAVCPVGKKAISH